MKILCLFILSFISFNTLYSQSIQLTSADEKNKKYFAEHIIVGTSFFALQDSGNENPEFRHNEYSWISNASLSLTKRIHLGAEYRFIRTHGSTTQEVGQATNFSMLGLFTQFDLYEEDRLRVFLQLGLDTGNYCACDLEADPFKVANRNYAGWGLGFNYRIFDNFSLDAQIYYNYLLNREDYNPYAYTYWALGVNYDLKRN